MNKKTFYVTVALLATSSVSLAKIHEVSSEAEFNKMIQHPKVVAEFSMQGCGACDAVAGPYKDLSNDPKYSDIRFLKIDVHQVSAFNKQYGIEGAPTFVYLSNGREVAQKTVGAPQDFSVYMSKQLSTAFATPSAADMPAPEEEAYAPEGGNGIKVELPPVPSPAAQQPDQQDGGGLGGMIQELISAVVNLIKQIVDAIINILSSIINAIKGMFGQ